MLRSFFQKYSKQVIVLSLVATLVFPNIASAQLVTTDPVVTGWTTAKFISDKAYQTIVPVLQNAATVAVVNVSQQVARDAAESVATWITSGGKGQNPLQYMKSPTDYIKSAGAQGLGDFLGNYSQALGLGDFLCHPTVGAIAVPTGLLDLFSPPDININANIDLGLPPAITVQPKCDFQSVLDSYDALGTSVSQTSDQLLGSIGDIAKKGGEIDSVMADQMQAFTKMQISASQTAATLAASPSHAPVVSPISGDILRPGSLVAIEASANTAKAQQEKETQTMSGLLASGASAIPSIFASTLFNSLSKKIMERLFSGKGDVPSSEEKLGLNLANAFGAGGRAVANGTASTNIFTSTKTATVSEGDWDQLTVFSSCPTEFAQADNCVIEQGFASAIRNAQTGNALTVKDALANGTLHGDWELVPPSQVAQNEDPNCYKSSYCYSNLVKLRKARIIPIGWEIAAANSDGNGKVTLGLVASKFNDCAYVKNVPTRDPQHPYCHLIDPDWVLKMPQTVCRAKVYGSVPESSQGASRQQECADETSCLQEDSTGQCTGAYGYCMRERNTFTFDAPSCPAQFAGCRTFSNKQSGEVNLIESTVDSSQCTAANAGCTGYITDYKGGAYDQTSTKIYLNASAPTCEAKNIGCTEVTDTNNAQTAFVRLPPATLGCKGESTDPVQCADYAQACTVDEVGCELYKPTEGADPAVPGIATFATRDSTGAVTNGEWNNECPSECVGYASYYQVPTQSEPTQNVTTAFIPRSATECTQEDAGCDAYLNTDTSAKGAGKTDYYTQLQRCRKPDDTGINFATFYTWEGSDNQGYQLHQHALVTDPADGSPVYDAASADITTYNTACNETTYKNDRLINGKPNPNFDPDCRELLSNTGGGASTGKTFYRLISKTLPVSADCTSYRKESVTQSDCEASRGVFSSGACAYEAIPAQSLTCKAESVGCRGYQGATAADAQNILTDNFSTLGSWTGGILSAEGITVGDTVLKVTDATAGGKHAIKLAGGKTYNLRFWAKGVNTFDVAITSPNNGGAVYKFSQVSQTLAPEWRAYELNSVSIPNADDSAIISFIPSSTANSVLYVDNVTLKEQGEVLYEIRDSWKTPTSCDPNPGDGMPGPALNCREYQPQSDTKKPTVYLTSFTNLCRPQSAGCSRYQNTYNTQEITERTVPVSKDGKITKTIPADDFAYVIAKPSAFCTQDKKGCSALGVESSDAQGHATLDTVYKINNPETYSTTSCFQEEEWCQTFTADGGQQRYFKYPPQDHQCEYRDSVDIAGVSHSGWFKVGSVADPCYTDYLDSTGAYGIYHNADASYVGNVGLCTKDFNACTQFIDHADTSRENPAGRSYFLMNNSKLDTTSCNGNASPKAGCVLLENTSASSTNNNIATLATYCKSDPTVSPNCGTILSDLGITADQQQKDGTAVSPVTAAPFVAPDPNDQIDCSAASNLGLYQATSCDDKLSLLKKVSLNGVIVEHAAVIGLNNLVTFTTKTVDISNRNCTTDSELIDNDVAEVQIKCSTYADANVLVKARPDRTCSEWLSCKSSATVYDPQSGKYKSVCSELGVCNKLSSDSGAVGQCANWVVPQPGSDQDIQRTKPLTTDEYVSRNVGWYGQEYTGYSLWNKFQPDQLGWFNAATAGATSDLVLGAGLHSTDCNIKNDGDPCTADIFNDSKFVKDPDLVYDGSCYAKKCWYSADGLKRKQATLDDYTKLTCRGYPEVDSPFPSTVVDQTNIFGVPTKRAANFSAVNICDTNAFVQPFRSSDDWLNITDFAAITGEGVTNSANGSCECSYKKVTYGDIGDVHYYSLKNSPVIEFFHVGDIVIPNQKCADKTDVSHVPAKITRASNGSYDVAFSGTCSLVPSGVLKNLSTADFYKAGINIDKIPLGVKDRAIGFSDTLVGGDGTWYAITIDYYDESAKLYHTTFPDLQKLTLTSDQIAIPASSITANTGEVPPKGICDGGWYVNGSKVVASPDAVSKKGVSCSTDFDCIDERVNKLTLRVDPINNSKPDPYQYSTQDGHCQFQKANVTTIGWQGYCLEQDLRTHLNNTNDSRACLTWLPLDVGGADIYNQYTSAGFQPSSDGGGKYYCAESRGRMNASNADPYAVTPIYTPQQAANQNYVSGQLDYMFAAPAKVSGWANFVTGFADAFTGGLYSQLYGTSDQTAFSQSVCAADQDCTNPNVTVASASTGYRDYGKASLDNTIKASEIDYIEVSANANNALFPVGYTMKIVNDGKVRVYISSKNKKQNSSMSCPAVRAFSTDGADIYDFFDPAADQFSGVDTTGNKKQVDLLSDLSAQVRCSSNTNLGGFPSALCDFYKGGKPDPKYFVCSTGETNVDATTNAVAVTGVAKYESGIYGQTVPSVSGAGNLGEIWFLRTDNRTYATSEDSSNGVKHGPQSDELGNRVLVNDIITSDSGGESAGPGFEVSNLGSWTDCTSLGKGWGDTGAQDNIAKDALQYGYTMRFKFNKLGGFEGIDAGHCTRRAYSTNHYLGWNVKVHLRDACTAVARVVDSNGTDNAAWTNRVWSSVPKTYSNNYGAYLSSTGALPIGPKGTTGYIPPSDDRTYGSLKSLSDPGVATPGVIDPWFGYAVSTNNTGALFGNAVVGKSFSCPTGLVTGCVTGTNGKVSSADGLDGIKNLFAFIYGMYRNNDLMQNYSPDTNYDTSTGDYRTSDVAKAAHPTVFALDPTACNGSTQTCHMTQRDDFSINGIWQAGQTVFGKTSLSARTQFYGWADENHGPLKRVTIDWGDGTPNLVKDGLYRNHKAVCSTDTRPATVCVTGEGTASETILDINHSCNTSADCVGATGALIKGATCQKIDDTIDGLPALKWSFGSWAGTKSGDDGACEQNYFEFGHAYTFTPDCGASNGGSTDVGALKVADNANILQYNLTGKISVGERFCVYQPKVQLLDNWNVCNAVGGGVGGYLDLEKTMMSCKINIDNNPHNAATPYQGYVVVKE